MFAVSLALEYAEVGFSESKFVPLATVHAAVPEGFGVFGCSKGIWCQFRLCLPWSCSISQELRKLRSPNFVLVSDFPDL